MSALRKKWNVTYGRVKKATGKAEDDGSPIEEPEFLDILNRFRGMREQYTLLEAASQDFYKTKNDLIIRGRELSYAFENLSPETSGRCSKAYTAMSKAHENTSDVDELLNTTFSNHILSPLTEIAGNELIECNNIKHEYYAAKMHYDACYVSVEKIKSKGIDKGIKLAEVEAQMVSAKNELDTAKEKFTSAICELEVKRDGAMYDSLQAYIEALAASYDPQNVTSTRSLLLRENYTQDPLPPRTKRKEADPKPKSEEEDTTEFSPEAEKLKKKKEETLDSTKPVEEKKDNKQMEERKEDTPQAAIPGPSKSKKKLNTKPKVNSKQKPNEAETNITKSSSSVSKPRRRKRTHSHRKTPSGGVPPLPLRPVPTRESVNDTPPLPRTKPAQFDKEKNDGKPNQPDPAGIRADNSDTQLDQDTVYDQEQEKRKSRSRSNLSTEADQGPEVLYSDSEQESGYDSEDDSPLPPNWEKQVDDDDSIYYWNIKTEESSWVRPNPDGTIPEESSSEDEYSD